MPNPTNTKQASITLTGLTGGIPAEPTQYIYPPRAQDAIPPTETNVYATLGWTAQLKYNDTHVLIKYNPGWDQPDPGTTNTRAIQLWGRHGELLRDYHAPDWLYRELQDLGHQLNLDPNNWSLLDGGILDRKHVAIKDTIVIWDILVLNGSHLIGTKYQDRYHRISSLENKTNPNWTYHTPNGQPHNLGIQQTTNIFIPKNYPAEAWPTLWDMIHKINNDYSQPLLEGLVFKDPYGKLEMGFREKNNSGWLGRSRIQTGRHRF